MKLVAPVTARFKDADLERMRREHGGKIEELQKLPAVGLTKLTDKVLPDGVLTLIAHPLGREPFVWHSPPRGPVTTGRIEEVRDGSYDRTKFVGLKASGFGGPVTVDVAVF